MTLAPPDVAPHQRATAVALLIVAADPAARTAVRRRLARVAALDAPQLAPLRGIGEQTDGFRLSYDLPEGAVSLDRLRRERVVTPAQLVGVALELCQALAVLHAAGLAHGRLGSEQVYVTAYGTTLLAGATGARSTADDVAALAGMLRELLPADVLDPAARTLLERAVDRDPARRPRLAAVGELLERLCSPEPIDLVPEPEPGPASVPGGVSVPGVVSVRLRHRRTHRRPGRRAGWVLAAVGALLMLLGARLTVAAIGNGPVPAAAAPGMPSADPGRPDWAKVIASLDERRAAALADGSAATLATAVDPSGPAFARDLAVLQARQQVGVQVAGGALEVVDVDLVEDNGWSVVLAVTDTRAAYQLRDRTGAVVVDEPARDEWSWRVTLSRDGEGWRIADTVATPVDQETPR